MIDVTVWHDCFGQHTKLTYSLMVKFHDKKRSIKDCDSTHKTATHAATLHYTKNKNRNA